MNSYPGFPSPAWYDTGLGGYSIVLNDGTILPQRNLLQFLNPASITDNPNNPLGPSTDIVLPSGTSSPQLRVDVTNETVTATLYARHRVFATTSACVINLPSGAGEGVQVKVKIKTALSPTLSLTVNAPGGGTIEQALEQADIGGVFEGSALFESAASIGESFTWECDGANNWELV
jgi:hypothetical protein